MTRAEKEGGRIGEKLRGGGGRAFSYSHIVYPQSGFHPPSHQHPTLRNPSAKYAHTHTNYSKVQSHVYRLASQTCFVWIVGNCLKRYKESQNRFPLIIEKVSLRGGWILEPLQLIGNKIIFFSFVQQEIKEALVQVSQHRWTHLSAAICCDETSFSSINLGVFYRVKLNSTRYIAYAYAS